MMLLRTELACSPLQPNTKVIFHVLNDKEGFYLQQIIVNDLGIFMDPTVAIIYHTSVGSINVLPE